MTNEEIKNKLRRGLALTVKESWDLYKYIEVLEQTELNPSYNGVKSELKPCEDWKFYYNHGYAQARNDVLDKIKAEIIELRSKQNVGVLECLDIIDKYKAESEG